MKKPKCLHTLGFTESNGYDGAIETHFISLEGYNDLKTLKEFKISGSMFNFCPYCGKKTEGLLDKQINKMTMEIQQRDEAEKKQYEEAEKVFLKKVEDFSKITKLDQLPDEGSFVVVFHPTTHSYGNDLILTGPKNNILRNCVYYNKNKSIPDSLLVKSIFKVISIEKLMKILVVHNWKHLSGEVFEKVVNNKTTQLSLDSGGIVYITEKTVDSDGDMQRDSTHFGLNRLSEYLQIEIPLETITLI